jgi:hypothetical protein
LRTHIVVFLRIVIGNGIEKVREEEHPQDAEYDEELNQDKHP